MGIVLENETVELASVTELPPIASEDVTTVAILYVIQNNQDFNITIGSLVDIVGRYINRQSLGISNVNNTSDEDKPLSAAAIEALEQKADRNNTVSMQSFNELSQLLSGKISTQTFEVQMAALVDRITPLEAISTESITLLVNGLLESVYEAINQVSNTNTQLVQDLIQANIEIADLKERVAVVESTSSDALLTRIIALENSLENAVVRGLSQL